MKKTLLSFLSLICMLSVAAEEEQVYYSFEKDGIYYNIHTEDYIFERPWNFGDLEIIPTDPYVTVVAKDPVDKPFLYDVMECEPYLSNEGNAYSGDVVVPAEVEYEGVTYPVRKIDYGAFEKCHNLRSVKLPESIESIEPYAFYDCPNLEEFNMPSKVVKDFNLWNVFNCVKLKSLNLTNIADYTYFRFNWTANEITAEWKALEELWLPIAAKGCHIENLVSDAKFHITTSVPPVGYEFDESVFERATLIVPVGAKEAYKNAPVWENFKVLEEGETGIGSVDASAEVTGVRYVDLTGREVLQPTAGIYIRTTSYSDGKTVTDKVSL